MNKSRILPSVAVVTVLFTSMVSTNGRENLLLGSESKPWAAMETDQERSES